jgi:hypothetical protein
MCAGGFAPPHYTLAMNARDIALYNQILRVEVGSTLHGTGLPGHEDRDEMGICIQPPSHLIGLNTFEHYEYRSAGQGNRSQPGDLDLIVYSLRKYVSLAKQGNPSILLTLFVPEEKIIRKDTTGTELMNRASWFHSKKAAARYLGYIQSQKLALTGERKSGIPKRPELIEAYGFDTKYAMHAVRLGFQGIEFLSDAHITLPMKNPEGDLCRAIRRGEVKFETILGLIDSLEERLQELRDDPKIPSEPCHEAIDDWLINAHLRHWSMRGLVGTQK